MKTTKTIGKGTCQQTTIKEWPVEEVIQTVKVCILLKWTGNRPGRTLKRWASVIAVPVVKSSSGKKKQILPAGVPFKKSCCGGVKKRE